MNITSKQEEITTGKNELFAFLEDLTNYKQLMPDQITDWEAGKERFRFSVPGMAEIGMKLADVKRHERVVLSANGKVPFNFSLTFQITAGDESQQAHIEFAGDVPAMLSMMAKKPLQNLIDHMISSLSQHFRD